MNRTSNIIIFTLDELDCAIALEAVEQVVRMVEITPLPEAPALVQGIINVQGAVVPVVDLRQRFGMDQRPITLTDQLIIVRWAERVLALKIDSVREVCLCPEETLTSSDAIFPHLPFLDGVVTSADGLILIHDLDQLLSESDYQIIHGLREKEDV
nr:chemotaxis protein CheW [uncultured Desulfuromonas sp.]